MTISDTARRLGRKMRIRAGGFALNGASRLLARLLTFHPGADPGRHAISRTVDVPYRDTGRREHLLDIYRPLGEVRQPMPVVLYMHGGGFQMLSKETHWLMSIAFARRGYLVLNANYRLSPRHPFPAALEDLSWAYRFAAERAEELGGDPSRVILAGESAGANLALAMTVAACFERPEPWARRVFDTPLRPVVTVPACGVLQVSDPDRFSRRRRLHTFVQDRVSEVEEAYLGGADAAQPGGLELADPLVALEKAPAPQRPLPAVFSFAGTRDPLLDDTRRLGHALERLGARHLERYYPGEFHAFHVYSWRPQAAACWQETFDFVSSVVGPPTAPARLQRRASATPTFWRPIPVVEVASPDPELAGG